MAWNVRVRTRKTGPEGEHILTRQDEKNNILDCLLFGAFLVLSNALLDEPRDERCGERLVKCEVDCGTADIVPLELASSSSC